MKVFIKKNDFVISTILIVLFSIFIFLPFFIYTPLIQLSMDTFDYSYLAKLIFDGNLPVKDLKIDLRTYFGQKQAYQNLLSILNIYNGLV